MTMKRSDASWMPADEYGRQLPKFCVNLLVRDVQRSLPFYRDVLGAAVRYSDEDFATLNLAGFEFMLHSDHAYDHHRCTNVSSPPALLFAAPAPNFASLESIPMHSNRAPGLAESMSCNPPPIIRMDGAT